MIGLMFSPTSCNQKPNFKGSQDLMPTHLKHEAGGQDSTTPFSTRKIYALALTVTVVILLSISIYIDQTYQQSFRQNLREQTLNQLLRVKSDLERTLSVTTQSVIGLAAAVSSEPTMSQAKFSVQAQYLKQNVPQLLSLSAAPDMIIKMVYPEQENRAAIGLNLATHPTQATDALRAKQLRELVVTGPVQLVQGGRAFIGRAPVFIPASKDRPEVFWGLVSALISPDILFKQVGLTDSELPIKVSIRKHAGLRMQQLFGNPNTFNQKPITSFIHLPYGNWEVAVVPVAGWNQTPPYTHLLRLILIVVNLVVLIPLFFVANLLRKKQSDEYRLRALINLSPLGIALTNYQTGQFVEINPALLNPTGYSKKEFLNLNYRDLTPIEYEEQDRQQLALLDRTGRYGPYEKEHIRKDGTRYPVLLNGMLIRDEDGKRYIWTTVEDITERKLNEENAARQQQRFDVMSQLSRIGAWEHDFETGKTYCSPITREIHGVSAATDINPSSLTTFYPHTLSRQTLQSAIKWAQSDGTPWQEEVLLHRADGKDIWILSTGHAEFKDGKCIRIYGACQDINDQIKQRQELIQAKEAAETATKAKSLFLATMSHQIRTPLKSVLDILIQLQRENLQAEQLHKVTLAKNSAETLLNLINNILDFSKIEAGKMELENIPFNLPTLIENIVETLAVKAQDKGLEISLNFVDMPVTHSLGDPNRLHQILYNLINNAIKFTDQGYINVDVHLQVEKSFYLLTCEVSDTGIGMTSEQQGKLFRSFTRTDTGTTREFDGSGLGLAICKSLCELMGGTISLKSVVGAGSQFTFQIQLAPIATSINVDVPEYTGEVTLYFVSPRDNNLRALDNRCQQLNIKSIAVQNAQAAIAAAQGRDPKHAILLLDSALPQTAISELLESTVFAKCLKAIVRPIKDSDKPLPLPTLQLSISKPITEKGLLTLVDSAIHTSQ